MVKKGQQDMFIQFTFEHNNSIYQVTRTRSLKGRGKSSCEFQELINGQWTNKSGATIAETDKAIQQLLSIDYSTFIASSLIIQGDSNNFTSKTPALRKTVLAQILNLAIYDELMKSAREKEKGLTIQLETSKNKLADLKEKLQELPAIEADMQLNKNDIVYIAADIRTKETALSDAQQVVKDLEGKEQQAKEVKRQMDDICTDIHLMQTDIAVYNLRIDEAQTVLLDEPTILAKVAELEEVKSKLPALQAKADRIIQLQADRKKITDDGLQLVANRNALAEKVEALEKDLSRRDELMLADRDYRQELLKLKDAEADCQQYQILADALDDAEMALLRTSTDLDKLLNEYGQLEKKVLILKDSGCIDSQNATCRFLADAKEAESKMPALKTEIEAKRQALGPLYKAKDKHKTDRDKLGYDSMAHANLKKRVESLHVQVEAYAQLSGKEELLKNHKEQKESLNTRITDTEQNIEKIVQEIERLQSEIETLPDLKAQIPELEKYVAMKDRLPEAKTTIQLSKEQITKLQADIDQKNEQHIKLLSNYTTLSAEFAGLLPDAREKVETINGELKALQVDQNTLYAEQGTIKAKLQALQKDAEEKERLSSELAPKAKELVRWQTLVKAFSKNGIPALIIENSIPELERISNDILSQMSNGAHSLRFETQRDLKSKDGVAETLDIIVSDWSGSRPYETYSGGEQTRIDLAIRVGLSELLANRAGSKIEFLIMDEVLSDQSPEFRELTVAAIKSIKDRFKKILLISHIPEVQNAFEQRIVLSEGGQIQIEFN